MSINMVYTRTGDSGTTSLVGGVRTEKDNVRLEAYGTVDELNSHLGLLSAMTDDESIRAELQWIQNSLFAVGSFLATDLSTTQVNEASVVTEEMITHIEKNIDEIETSLPRLKAFVLPGGCVAAAQCNVCRTVCRRAERRIVTMVKFIDADEAQYATLLKYINRLSDFLFVLGRKLNNIANIDEIFWNNVCQ
ncbi:MAG: cob(I)yrinic acid a,c-diamide adenosyltransferase [Bacteroidaceae bacterium]|nr:cob(I)yrinic acid a,c-diamide adenosyltransferase [Bacteroidaceae bacterium]